MSDGVKIKLIGDDLAETEKKAKAVADALSSTGTGLGSAVPPEALGALGVPLAFAANTYGDYYGKLVASLSRFVDTIASGTTSIRSEFEAIEDSAASRFRDIERELNS